MVQDKNINKQIQDMILDPFTTKQEVIKFVQEKCGNIALTPMTLGMLFEVYAGVEYDENDPLSCYTDEILISDLIKVHPSFQSTNGCQWARDDGSYLGKRYHIKRERKSNKVYSVKLDGPNENSVKKFRHIRSDIRKAIASKRCVVLDITKNIEVDHKNGKYDTLTNIDPAKQKLEEFQPLSKAANDAKRQHCKECKASGKRYDARRLGYKEGWIVGDENTKHCSGCYWYDPLLFHKTISKDFHKTK